MLRGHETDLSSRASTTQVVPSPCAPQASPATQPKPSCPQQGGAAVRSLIDGLWADLCSLYKPELFDGAKVAKRLK